MIRLVTAAIAVALLAAPAAAATVSFDFTGGSGRSAATHAFSEDGLDLNVGGRKCFLGACGGVPVQHWSNGFGVDYGVLDNHQVDGALGNEAVTLAFSRAVSITALSFSYADRSDDVAVFRLADGAYVHEASGPIVRLGGRLGSFTLTGGTSATGFAVAALDWDDAFKLRGVTVRYDDPEVAPVPLPAAGWMLLAAMGGLAAARRRARA